MKAGFWCFVPLDTFRLIQIVSKLIVLYEAEIIIRTGFWR
jgi:hypothetical protein